MTETYETGAAAPKRQGRKAVVIILSSLVVLVVGGLVAALMYLNSLGNTFDESVQTFPEDDTFPEESERPERDEDDESLNILLLGADSGGDGSGETEDLPQVPNSGRSDTIMLLHVPEDRDSVQVMSIMRDLWVEIPGHGEHKINAALSLGGIGLTVHTIESMFDSRIDHVAAVDLEGFEGLVDAMDGVTVDSPEAFTAREGTDFAAGPQQMDGGTALTFVRERQAFTDGDYTRVRNQQAFVNGVLSEMLSPSNLTSPGRVQDMVEEFSPFITVDDTLDSSTLGSMAWSMRDVRGSNIDMFTLPTGGLGRSSDGQSIVLRDDAAIAEIGSALQEDTLEDYLQSADL